MAGKLMGWSAAVKARDGRCMECGSLEDLHAHHIKPKSTHPELKYELDNGKTLCYRCHKREHERTRHTVLPENRKPQRKILKRYIAERDEMIDGLRKEISLYKREVRRLQYIIKTREMRFAKESK